MTTTPEQIAAEAAAAEATANAEAKAKADAEIKAKTEAAAADAAALKAAQDKAKLSAAAVTPLALAMLQKEGAGLPAIRLGERRILQPVHGRIQNPVTLQWFESDPVKVEVDAWVLGQYYAEDQKLRLNEE